MPFVNQEHRKNPDLSIPGDRCYKWYRWMVDEWNKEPRWATADKIYTQVTIYHQQRQLTREALVALDLAWQVFFVMKVIPYEELKQEENGDIE